jgi:hypothetical protein
MRNDIVLYHPGDGIKKTSNSTLYKGIKEFKANNNGTVTFKTTKHGTITTAELWRLKENLPDDYVAPGCDENEAPAGNQARVRRGL